MQKKILKLTFKYFSKVIGLILAVIAFCATIGYLSKYFFGDYEAGIDFALAIFCLGNLLAICYSSAKSKVKYENDELVRQLKANNG